MERTIKFRGKSIYNDEWLYGYLIKLDEDRYAVVPVINDIEPGKCLSMFEVYIDTVGQFTGICDKNWKEIYEGDILFVGEEDDIKVYNKVGIKDGCFGYIGEISGELIPFYESEVTAVIVGNICDNPELLKGE